MASIKKYNYLLGEFFSDFTSDGSDRFKYVMDYVMGTALDSLLDNDAKETYAICMSNYLSREDTGQGINATDTKVVKVAEPNIIKAYIKVRRIGDSPVEDNFAPNPFHGPDGKSPEFTPAQVDLINDGFHEWAESESTFDNIEAVPRFGQIVIVKEDINGNLVWTVTPGDVQVLALSSGDSITTKFLGNLLGDYSTGVISKCDQIPNAIPPLVIGQNGARVSSVPGRRNPPVAGASGDDKIHAGVDVAAPIGTPLVAILDGVVADVRGEKFGLTATAGFGTKILLKHEVALGQGVSGCDAKTGKRTIYSVYGHIHETFVKKGQTVKQGDHIASVGNEGTSSGPHLHFEIYYDTYNPGTRGASQVINPVDALGLRDSPGWGEKTSNF